MTVPIATSLGRSGFGPQLALSYDSGAGNGPFGFGWSLGSPQITRNTDKGLPQYDDAGESDVFILSGAEDLVPLLKQDAQGKWVREKPRSANRRQHDLPYPALPAPRQTGALHVSSAGPTPPIPSDVHWRSISKENILTLYGKDAGSRIADPAAPQRIFTWLICESRDDKGNAAFYEYASEDGSGVDLTRPHERNRGDANDPRRKTNRYIKRIRSGNRIPLLDDAGRRPCLF